MEEHFDVCDERGVPTGVALPRSEVHRRGLWHRSSHLWVVNGRGEILLQRRHPGKQTDPGRWDIAVAGHLSAGQTPLEAMVREAFEELGLRLATERLVFLGASPKQYIEPEFADREWQHAFAVVWDGDTADLVLQPDEVVAVRWMALEDYRRVVAARDDAYVGRLEDWPAFEAWL
jgi:isopentenyldiphosphate isomerase